MSAILRFVLILVLLTPLAVAANLLSENSVVPYPDSPLPKANEFSVKANGAEITVYNAGTFRCAPFAFAGSVKLEVTYHGGAIRSFQINPLSKGIIAQQKDSTLTFTIQKPEKLEVQINGASSQVVDGDKLLYLFADGIETNAPRPGDSNVIYFAPGVHNPDAGVLRIDDADPHSAMYVAPGALLNAALEIRRTKPFKIYGRGFIRYPFTTKDHYALRLDDCLNVSVEDITLFDSVSHSIKFFGGRGNVVRNVKALHYVVNSDGISFHRSATSNLVENCFIVGNDNLIVIGGGGRGGGSGGMVGVAHNTVVGCTFVKSSYAGNWGFPQGDGPIGPGNLIKDCDVIRCNGEVGLIRMFWRRPTTVANLIFENIRVQSFEGYQPNPEKTYANRFLSLESGDPEYMRAFTFKNIYLPSAQSSMISDGNWEITFDHVYVAGKPVTCDSDLKLTKGAGVVTHYIF